MTSVAELELPHFDYLDPSLRGERYHAAMAQLEGWLAAGTLGYVVLDREAGEFFLRSKACDFPGMTIAELVGIEDGPLYEEMRRNIINLNGDGHRRLRNLLNPVLAPRAAERHRPAMRRILETLPTSGSVEFVSAFAKPYPSLVIAELVGADPADAPKLHDWSNWIQRQFDAPSLMEHRAPIEQAVEEFHAWFQDLLGSKRREPGEDLTSQLLQVDGLEEVELVNLVLDVILGGIDTAQSQLSHTMRLLAEHPGQWALLRERPELAVAAVEESLRYEPVTPFTARITTDTVEYRDVTFPPGTVLMISAFHANRESGGEFDIAAERERARILTFGAGIHYCVGANLARAELQEALTFLAERVERVEADGTPDYGTITGIYGIDSLPLRLS
ncbi:MAG: cytochrome P450 [Thermoleophilaceae bacterium]